MEETSVQFKSAFVALIGRPNSGKSTLLNAIIGERLAIVTSLPQTTRTVFRGIYTSENLQIVFLDTPGIHRGRHTLNKSMYASSTRLLTDSGVDIVCYMVDLSRPGGAEEDEIAGLVEKISASVCIVFNKADLCPSPDQRREEFFSRYPALASRSHVTLSAIAADAKQKLLDMLMPLIGSGPRYYPNDDLTDSDMRFISAEFIRKRIIESTREEVPHAVHVEILTYRELPDKHDIDAAIHVESDGQKGIIIGNKGKLIQKIQQQAQEDIAALVGTRVSLRCHIKVTPRWRDDKKFLSQMGIGMHSGKQDVHAKEKEMEDDEE